MAVALKFTVGPTAWTKGTFHKLQSPAGCWKQYDTRTISIRAFPSHRSLATYRTVGDQKASTGCRESSSALIVIEPRTPGRPFRDLRMTHELIKRLFG